MSERVLPGLRASTPIGALAAFGLLRVCARLALPQPVRLGWRLQQDWLAVLDFPEPVVAEALVAALAAAMPERAQASELHWRDDIKMPAAEFAAFARQAQEAARPEARDTADFVAAFGSELVLAKSKPEVKPTALHMTAGQQRFLRMVRDLAQVLAADEGRDAGAILREALFGPWRYQDQQHSLGWDPSTERLHALRARSPTKEQASGVAGAVWLAYESLPLLPTAAVNRRLVTAGFDAEARFFSWPVWETPLRLEVVKSLLGLAELTKPEPSAQALRARGIRRVYRSQRAPMGDKGYAIFRAADVVF